MKKLFFAMALVAAMTLGSSSAWAQCCDDPDAAGGDLNDCPPIPTVGATEGCTDDGAGTCIGGSLASGPGPAGCICVAGSCTSDTDGGDCADEADNACEDDTSGDGA